MKCQLKNYTNQRLKNEERKVKLLSVKFKDNIWAADLAEVGSFVLKIEVRNLLYVIDVLIKYAVVKPWRSIKAKTVIDGFA